LDELIIWTTLEGTSPLFPPSKKILLADAVADSDKRGRLRMTVKFSALTELYISTLVENVEPLRVPPPNAAIASN
jgi:hypothetical protein